MVVVGKEASDSKRLEVGDRIEVSGYRGTVKYVGAVAAKEGLWVGVDWDCPTRGKHDGSYDGVNYFITKYTTSGSFIRMEKADRGQNIISAIEERYGGTGSVMDEETIHELERALNAPFLQLVGFDQIAKKQRSEALSVVGVREHRVNSAGEPGLLKQFAPGIVELDLGGNLLKSWKSVHEIVTQLEHLEFLDLSDNKLSYEDCDLETMQDGYKKLKFLVLANVEYNWNEILKCSVMWPHILRLQVSYNLITTIEPPPAEIFKSLVMLNLEGNNITDWGEILKLGPLPKLEVLNLTNTQQTKIYFPTPNNLFPVLKTMILSKNYINEWESVSELDKLPSLTDLKFRDNPLFRDVAIETVRQLIIARVSKLKILNSQEILADERRGAEYDYMKMYARTWIESGSDPENRERFLKIHPRYPSLINKYGEISSSELEKQSTALKSRLINVTLKSGDRSVTKKIPDAMTVQRLCGLAQRIFKTSRHLPTLTLVSSKNPAISIPLDNSLKPLNFFSIEDEDIIHVSCPN